MPPLGSAVCCPSVPGTSSKCQLFPSPRPHWLPWLWLRSLASVWPALPAGLRGLSLAQEASWGWRQGCQGL